MNIVHEVFRIGRVLLACVGLASLFACGGGDPSAESDGATESRATTKALSTTTQKTVYKSELAYGLYYQYNDASSCTSTTLEVFALDYKTQFDGTTTNEPALLVQLLEYDCSTGEFTGGQALIDPPRTIQISMDLAIARAKGNVVLVDNLGAAHTVSVDLQWNGGQLFSEPDTRTVIKTPPTKTVLISSSATRYTESLTGSLVLDGVDLLSPANTNPTRGTSGYVASGATIERIKTR